MQATAFQAQIQLALRYNLPLVLHVRDQGRSWDGGEAEEDCYGILEECKVPRDFPIHRHCFNGGVFTEKGWLSINTQGIGSLHKGGCQPSLPARSGSRLLLLSLSEYMGIVCWDIVNKNQTGHFTSMRLLGESPFLVCCWRPMPHTLLHVHLIPLYPTWLWWRIQSRSKWICHICFPIAIVHYIHRVDFAQPGHVLQVAAAVAHLKGVPLKQVDIGHARYWPQLPLLKFWLWKRCTIESFHCRCSWLIYRTSQKSMVWPPPDKTEIIMEKWIVDQKWFTSFFFWMLSCHFHFV